MLKASFFCKTRGSVACLVDGVCFYAASKLHANQTFLTKDQNDIVEFRCLMHSKCVNWTGECSCFFGNRKALPVTTHPPPPPATHLLFSSFTRAKESPSLSYNFLGNDPHYHYHHLRAPCAYYVPNQYNVTDCLCHLISYLQ